MVNAPRYTGNLINHLSLDKNAYTDETQKAEAVLSAVSYIYIYIYICTLYYTTSIIVQCHKNCALSVATCNLRRSIFSSSR